MAKIKGKQDDEDSAVQGRSNTSQLAGDKTEDVEIPAFIQPKLDEGLDLANEMGSYTTTEYPNRRV